eukprot:SAG22_NODE_1128_length_5460_cov_15.018280_5_plen_132_part_00
MVMANAGLRQGQSPAGSLGCRGYGSVVDVGNLDGSERWSLSATAFTDLCTLSLAHRLEHNEANRSYGPREPMNAVMATHLGGAAEAEYAATMAGIEAAMAAGETVHNGYDHVKGEAEPKFMDVYYLPAARL